MSRHSLWDHCWHLLVLLAVMHQQARATALIGGSAGIEAVCIQIYHLRASASLSSTSLLQSLSVRTPCLLLPSMSCRNALSRARFTKVTACAGGYGDRDQGGYGFDRPDYNAGDRGSDRQAYAHKLHVSLPFSAKHMADWGQPMCKACLQINPGLLSSLIMTPPPNSIPLQYGSPNTWHAYIGCICLDNHGCTRLSETRGVMVPGKWA